MGEQVPMTQKMKISDVKNQLSSLVNEVYRKETRVLVEKAGIPVAALVSAGDLVFFENTFERGLSHVGIYLEHGRFIHAENEQTGVIVSRIDSDYYAAHYYGARRLP